MMVSCVGLFDHQTYHVLIFFSGGHMKTTVFGTPVDNAEVLVSRIAVFPGEFLDMPGALQKVQISMYWR